MYQLNLEDYKQHFLKMKKRKRDDILYSQDENSFKKFLLETQIYSQT